MKDKYNLMKEIEKLNYEDQCEIHEWLWDKISKERRVRFKQALRRIRN